jgi:polyribonucleotide nucleotidyltransferase
MIINPLGKDIISVSGELCGRQLTLEVNRVGFRTTASVLARYGDTVVLGNVVVGKVDPTRDYFPLSIDYEEKFYAAGKISGSRFIKREGRPSDQAILSGRLIDRPIRPLFPKGYRQEVQAVASVLSMDPDFRPDIVAMIATSTALMVAGVPFDGPVAGLRVAYVDGQFKAFANPEEQARSSIDLTVAGIASGITMVEAGANEVPETLLADAFAWAHQAMQPAIELQKELVAKLAVEPLPYELVKPDEAILAEVEQWCQGKFMPDMRQQYPYRNRVVDELRQQMHTELEAQHGEAYAEVKAQYDEAFTMESHKDVRRGIIEDGVRPDGRALDEIRPLSSEVGILPRTHGSSLFTRGVTQAMNIVTLAPLSYAQIVDTMEITDGERRYMHHYNAPSYTVGECGRLGSPGRREIGHGYLAERALEPVLPAKEDFPYAIRSVTEIMSQNGSTSMAATCSSCLALMDAGVPLKRPVSGVAMGLMMGEDGQPYILTDIADTEDFAGDMDFKATGTELGVTALQMDMKVHGLPVEVLRKAILRAKEGREKIMEHMLSILPAPRKELSQYAPRIEKLMINPDKIGAVIGKGGETIREITSTTGAEIDIADDGLVTIAAVDAEAITKALEWVKSLTMEPEVGQIYTGKVVSIKEFGAFVNIMPGIDGMVHISEMADHRVAKVEDVVHLGAEVKVKLVAIDDKGRLKLSMKDAK